MADEEEVERVDSRSNEPGSPSFGTVTGWQEDTPGAFRQFLRRPLFGGLTPGVMLLAFVLPSIFAAALVLWVAAPASSSAAPEEQDVAVTQEPPATTPSSVEPVEASATPSDEMPEEVLRRAVSVGTGPATIRIKDRSLWGLGKIKGSSARMEKVLFTSSEGSSVWKHCAFVVYTYDPEWKVWEHVLVGYFEKSVDTGECGTEGVCGGGGGASFRQCLAQAGYEGPIPGSGATGAPPTKPASTAASCPESRVRNLFISTCVGLITSGAVETSSDDPKTFCGCAAGHVDYKKLRKLDVCSTADRFQMNGLELQLVVPVIKSVVATCAAR